MSIKWSYVIQPIFLEASLIRAVCYPLIHQEHVWKDLLDKEMKVQQKKFVEINEIIKEKLENLEMNRIDNALRALPIMLDEYFSKYEDADNFYLMTYTYKYLNDNFGYGRTGNFTKFNVVVVDSTDVYNRSPDLFYYSKGKRSVVVGLGKMWPKYNCDEQTDNGVKKLSCFKIGDKVISYHGEVEWYNWADSSKN